MTATTAQTKSLPQGTRPYAGINSAGKTHAKHDVDSKGIWLSMLEDASRGKNLAEKQLVVLGGTPEQQRDFLHSLHLPSPSATTSSSSKYRNNTNGQRHHRDDLAAIPLSNRFALGYTYQDVLDTDEQDILARLSVYMLSNPSATLAPLLRSLFTSRSVPNCLVVILLDWADVFGWAAELRQWIRVLRSVMAGLEGDVVRVMDDVMDGWKGRKGTSTGEGAGSAAAGSRGSGQDTTMSSSSSVAPLGPGEWDEGIGVPLCVVCMNAEKQEKMETDFGWQEGDFDFVLQWMRCVLLKHGASLIYTTSFDSNNAQTLIHSTLGIQSLLKRGTIKHNVIDREKILIPPNWDSWGKIRILREGFEMEKVANAWSVELQAPPEAEYDAKTKANEALKVPEETISRGGKTDNETAVSIFLSSLPNPSATQKPYLPPTATDDLVTVPDTQVFLAEQARRLEKMRQEDEESENRSRKTDAKSAPPGASGSVSGTTTSDPHRPHNPTTTTIRSNKPTEQTGPYNINVGGIQVDAEEVTRRIRQREADRERDQEAERQQRQQRQQTQRGRDRDGNRDGDKDNSKDKRVDSVTRISTTGGGGSGGGGGGRSPLTPRKGGSPAAAAAGTTPDGSKPHPEALASYFDRLLKNAEKKESPRREGGGGGSAGGGS